MRQALLGALFVLTVAGCAARSGPVPAAAGAASAAVEPDSTAAPADRLTAALESETWGPMQMRVLASLDAQLGRNAVDYLLSLVVKDTAASRAARATAALQIGDRKATTGLGALRAAADDPDPVLRAAVMFSAGQLLDTSRQQVLRILKLGLADTDEMVRAKALQSVGDAEPEYLREFLAGSPSAQLRGVAAELLDLAYQRGAPWGDSVTIAAGAPLRRTTPSGVTLEFRPVRRFPFGAAVGDLYVSMPGKAAQRVASDVEVVAGVVPAVLSPDAARLALEASRTIAVVDLASGDTQVVGAGIAPRPLPLGSGFVYLVERPEGRADQERGGTQLEYEVMLASFGGSSAPKAIGRVVALSRGEHHGGYSSARMIRVVQSGDHFLLLLPEGGEFQLPDMIGAE